MEQICAICGRPLPENVTACPKCGTSVPTKPLGAQFVPEKPADTTPKHSGNCAICGRPLPEDADLCPNCGSSVHIELVAPQAEPEPPVVPTVTEEPPEAETPAKNPRPNPIACIANFWKKLSKKTKIITGITAGVLVLAIPLIAFLCGGALTPHATLDNYVALLNGDINKLDHFLPQAYLDNRAENFQGIYGDTGKEYLAHIKDNMAFSLTSLETAYGEYEVTYKLLNEEDLDEAALNQIRERFKVFDIDPDDVTAAKRLDIALTIDGSKRTDEKTGSYASVKIGAYWYLFTYQRDADGVLRVGVIPLR